MPLKQKGDAGKNPTRKTTDVSGEQKLDTGALFADMLKRVAAARGLPIKHAVPGKLLGREEMLARIKETVERDTPRDIMAGQGEILASLELIPPTYDFVAGAFALLGGRVAGFYDPDDATMYLADDLDEDETTSTLAHELAHALADQTFPLKPMVEYGPGQNDRVSAAHSVIEGDAMSAMLDVMLGSAFDMPEEALRLNFNASTMMSEIGAKTPRSINSSLVAPYVDGFSFIQELRRRGDWRAVDEAWRKMPETTEQLLHVDKLLAREPEEKLPALSLGEWEKLGYKVLIDDVIGEQQYRITFEDWTSRGEARRAAEGWGGDRVVVMSRVEGGKSQFGLALRLRMDTVKDAGEVGLVLERKFGAGCKERPMLGPVKWSRVGRDLALVAGPYEREGQTPTSIATCESAKRWLEEVWRAAPAVVDAKDHRGR